VTFWQSVLALENQFQYRSVKTGLKGGPEPSNFEDLCLVNVSVKYFSKLCFGTSKIQLNCNIWKPFLKSSPLDFSGQRLGNTSLVVFLRFHSFSLVVKWPEFQWYIIQVFEQLNVNTVQWIKVSSFPRKVVGSNPEYIETLNFWKNYHQKVLGCKRYMLLLRFERGSSTFETWRNIR